MSGLPDVQPIPAPSPRGAVARGNILLTLAGLKTGHYLVRDLYPRFLAIEERMENDPPASRVQFGIGLQGVAERSGVAHGHARVWHVSAELLEEANDLYAKVAADKGWS